MRRNSGAFTLVELMVTVCILSIGMVGVARSLLSAFSALRYTQNIISKTWFLDNIMCELQDKVRQKDGFQGQDEDIESFLEEKNSEAEEKEIGSLEWSAKASEANAEIEEFEFKLAWQEANIEKNIILANYFPIKKLKEADIQAVSE